MRIVLDTSVLIAAIRSPAGASNALLEAILNGRIEIVISTALVLEYEAVLTRPGHLSVSELAPHDIEELLDAIITVAKEVAIRWHWRPQLTDPDDEMVLETAINGHADVIVTFNRADFGRAAKQFGLNVLLPREVLERVEIP